MNKRILLVGILGLWIWTVKAQVYTLESPLAELKVEVRIKDSRADLELYVHGERVGEVRTLQFAFDREGIEGDWQVDRIERKMVDDYWRPLYGECSRVHDCYRALTLFLKSADNQKKMALKVRLYNEGLAFQYVFDESDFKDWTLLAEHTQFLFEKEGMTWVTSRAQGAYSAVALNAIRGIAERPQVVRLESCCYLAVGEAALVDYARMKLGRSEIGIGLQSVLTGKVVLEQADYHSPWRYVMVADNPGRLVEQNYMVLNLNESNKIKHTDWIKPGKVIREVTLTTAGGLACVDWAASHSIDYVEFDAGWYGPENDPASDATTVTVDPKRSKGPLDLHHVIEYAASKGVGIILYVNGIALKKQLNDILPLYQQWGVKGVKFGFVDVGDQQATSWLHQAVRLAAQCKLMVDIHDEYRPTGYSRTYPNLMTQEGIRGDEESPGLEQTIYTFYNRMIAGAGDYTNCYFARRVTEDMGGRAAQLAKLVAIYSPWQFVYWYDRPENAPSRNGGAGAEESVMKQDEVTDFYCSIPTVWDETRFLEGEMGEYVVVARRSGKDWYIAILNAGEKRRIKLPLQLLINQSSFQATLYYQSSGKEMVGRKTVDINQRREVMIEIAEDSGCVLYLGKGRGR